MMIPCESANGQCPQISNGGTVVYPFAAKLMEQTGHFEVVGHILDSAPGPWNRLAHIQ